MYLNKKESCGSKNCYSLRTSKATKECSCCANQSSPSSSSSHSLPIVKTEVNLLKGEYLVEKILSRKATGKCIKYLVKWKGYPDSCNTWEPAKNLFKCRDLISQYEKTLKHDQKPEEETLQLQQTMETGSTSCKDSIGMPKLPEKIIGTLEIDGQRCFLIQWTSEGDKKAADVVPVKEANIKWPQLVIQFYENHVKRASGTALREMLGDD